MEEAMKLAEWVDQVETVSQGVTAGVIPNATLVRMRLHDVYLAVRAHQCVFALFTCELQLSHSLLQVMHRKSLVPSTKRRRHHTNQFQEEGTAE
jgi:hypothetical protein